MKILCTNFHASIIKCTNFILFAAKQPDYEYAGHVKIHDQLLAIQSCFLYKLKLIPQNSCSRSLTSFKQLYIPLSYKTNGSPPPPPPPHTHTHTHTLKLLPPPMQLFLDVLA